MLTLKLMETLFPTKGLSKTKFNLVKYRAELVDAMNRILPRYGITNYFRICAFLANCGVETDYFKTTTEYASGEDYEGRAGLGNYFPGDGKKYKGSDLTQTTGRYNFWKAVCRFVKNRTGQDFSKDEKKYKNFKAYLASEDYKALLLVADIEGVNFLAKPELLRNNIDFAVESACIFWEQNNLNRYADKGEFKELSGIVNRGDADKLPLGWAKRKALYNKCLQVVPKDFNYKTSAVTQPTIPQVISNPTALDSASSANIPPSSSTDQSNDEQPPNNPPQVVKAPVSEGSTTTQTALTIGGFTVPTFLVAIFGVIKSTIEAGYFSASQVGEIILRFLTENTKYFFLLIGLIIVGLILKKAYKQISFFLQMYFAASKDLNNVEVKKQ